MMMSLRQSSLFLLWSCCIVVAVAGKAVAIVDAQERDDLERTNFRQDANIDEQPPRVLSIVDFGAISDEQIEGSRGNPNYLFSEFQQDPPTLHHSPPWWDNPQDTPHNITDITLLNTNAFNTALSHAKPGDTVLIPQDHSFALTGGVYAADLYNVTVDISGRLHFVHDQDVWPRFDAPHKLGSGNHYGFRPGIHFTDCQHLLLTCTADSRPTVHVNWDKSQVYMAQDSGSAGIVNGNGKLWWDEAILGRLPHKDPDYRPRLVLIESSVDTVVTRLTLINSPFWTLTIEGVRLRVSHVRVLVDRKYNTGGHDDSNLLTTTTTQRSMLRSSSWFPNDIPDWVGRKLHQPQDLNTDGIDPRGRDIVIHDCIVQNADDSVAVKPPVYGKHTTALHGTIPVPCTHNVTIKDTVLTGFGASIGSVGPHEWNFCVDSVLFQNISMPGTGKGIYIKSNKSQCRPGETAQITNIVYQDVYMKEPFWWAIWIGPQQQHEPNTKLDGDCPLAYPLPGSTHCPTQGCANFANITLRNIYIQDPFVSPGVILGNQTNPIQNLQVENITVTSSTWKPWHGKWPWRDGSYPFRGRFECQHVQGSCQDCFPAPRCLDVI